MLIYSTLQFKMSNFHIAPVLLGENTIAGAFSTIYSRWPSTQLYRHLVRVQISVERRRHIRFVSRLVCWYTTPFCRLCDTVNYVRFGCGLVTLITCECLNSAAQIKEYFILSSFSFFFYRCLQINRYF